MSGHFRAVQGDRRQEEICLRRGSGRVGRRPDHRSAGNVVTRILECHQRESHCAHRHGSAEESERQKKASRKSVQDAGIGDGPVDAALKAIDRLTKTRGKLMDYSLRAVSQGKDALGEVTVKVDFGDRELVTGKGASTDIIEASARAYLNAVNRFLNEGPLKRKASQP